MKRNTVWSIDIEATNLPKEPFRVTVWREEELFTKKRITKSAPTIARLHRAQLRLAGLPVEGWPWPEYCKCSIPANDFWLCDDATCKHCGKIIEWEMPQ